MTITDTHPDGDMVAPMRSLNSYRSLVWALRLGALAVAAWIVVALSDVSLLIVLGLICPLASLLVLLGTMVAVVSSQLIPNLPQDSVQSRAGLVGKIIASAAHDVVTGIPRGKP